jgi:hypothetical protein
VGDGSAFLAVRQEVVVNSQLRGQMDQQQASGKAILLKVRLFCVVAGSLIMLSSLFWTSVLGDHGTYPVIATVLFLIAFLTFIDLSLKLRHPRNLIIIVCAIIFMGSVAAHFLWRDGTIVAKARFDPGIAPFDIAVREVPVPVTQSHHFIVTLKRGQYPVTSFRYFWIGYTPKKVRIEWTRLEAFNVIFDERYTATCNWRWGSEATWTMKVPTGAEVPGDQP